MRLKNSYKAVGIVFGLAALMSAQQQMAPTLTVAPVPTVKAQKGAVAVVSLRAVLPPGFHANSNTPSDAYLIPLTLKWTGGPLEADGITYPRGTMEKYSFSDKPLSVVTGEFTITTKFKVPVSAATGASAQNGTLRYQACNDRMCFAPKTLNVSLSLNIE
jgi:Disulphide bond corrector protein DsbC